MNPTQNQNNINAISADELCRKYDCISFEDFDDALNYEMTKQFSEGGSR